MTTTPVYTRPFSAKPDALTVGFSVAAVFIVSGLMMGERPRLRLKPQPKPHPERRVTIYDQKTGQTFLLDRPYVREDQYEKDRYAFRFKDGSERFLDLSGHDYRIIRREV